METEGRRTRGFVLQELIRALRSEAEAEASDALTPADRQLLAQELDPSAWIDHQQCLRLAAVARERVCKRGWSEFHELGAASVEQLLELGYRTVLRFGDPTATFAAISVLWRASFGYGRAVADTDPWGVTVHVIDCPILGELEGNLHAGWCLGVARLIGSDCASMELRRRPWADEGDEQVVRLHWRGRPGKRRPTPAPTSRDRLLIAKPRTRAVG
jgi:hypothetical protein